MFAINEAIDTLQNIGQNETQSHTVLLYITWTLIWLFFLKFYTIMKKTSDWLHEHKLGCQMKAVNDSNIILCA